MLAGLFDSTKDFVSVPVPLQEEASADIFREFNILTQSTSMSKSGDCLK